jgi:shikimate kinase
MEIKNVILVGFMGTGKTTVGRVLAEKLDWPLVDMDMVIEQRAGMTIPDIFASEGEDYFRGTESSVLADLLKGSRQVISTGGGSVLAEANRKLMLAGGPVVALSASAETIMERVGHDPHRPLLQGGPEDRIRLLLQQRKHAYDFAHLRIETDGLDADRIAEIVLRELKLDSV